MPWTDLVPPVSSAAAGGGGGGGGLTSLTTADMERAGVTQTLGVTDGIVYLETLRNDAGAVTGNQLVRVALNGTVTRPFGGPFVETPGGAENTDLGRVVAWVESGALNYATEISARDDSTGAVTVTYDQGGATVTPAPDAGTQLAPVSQVEFCYFAKIDDTLNDLTTLVPYHEYRALGLSTTAGVMISLGLVDNDKSAAYTLLGTAYDAGAIGSEPPDAYVGYFVKDASNVVYHAIDAILAGAVIDTKYYLPGSITEVAATPTDFTNPPV